MSDFDSLLDYLGTPQEKVSVEQIRDIIPIKEWVRSKYYLGDTVDNLFPFWEDTIVEFFEGGYTELIFTGGTGTGKSHCALLVEKRLIYELSCYDFPALKFNLDKSSSIIFFYLCVTQTQAERIGFGKLRRLIDQTPYFQEHFRRKPIDSTIKFPKDVIQCYSGSDVSDFIGTDLYSIVLDEANFLSTGGGESGIMQKATNIYREASNRRKNRFISGEKEFGASIIVSSSDSQSSFTEQRILELKGDPKCLVKSARVYDVKPKEFPKERFWVFTGNTNISPFIVDEKNKEKYLEVLSLNHQEFADFTPPDEIKDQFTNVPVNYKGTFEMDIIGSLKEVAGVPSIKTDRFFGDIDKYNQCINPKLIKPFEMETFSVSTDDFRNKLILNLNPKFYGDERFKYYFAIDQSITGCRTGLGMGHIDGNGKCIIDLDFGITPPSAPEQINIRHIKEFIVYLKEKRGFNITTLIGDNFQSDETLQFFKGIGFNTFKFSVERDESYLFLKNKIAANEIEFYEYEIFRKEIFNLIHDVERRKILHPRNPDPKNRIYSKDVSDAVCRVVCNLFLYEPYDLLQKRKSSAIQDYIKFKTKKSEVDTLGGFAGFVKSNQVLKLEEKLIGDKLVKAQ